MGMKVHVDSPDDIKTYTADAKGRINLGTGWADEKVTVALLRDAHEDLPNRPDRAFEYATDSLDGVKQSFISRLSELCRLRGEVPEQTTMRELLLTQSSGVADEADAKLLANIYSMRLNEFDDGHDDVTPRFTT